MLGKVIHGWIYTNLPQGFGVLRFGLALGHDYHLVRGQNLRTVNCFTCYLLIQQ